MQPHSFQSHPSSLWCSRREQLPLSSCHHHFAHPLFEQGCQFLVGWGESRLAFSNSHLSSQSYPDPIWLILSATTPGHRVSLQHNTICLSGTQAQLHTCNKTCLSMEVGMAAEPLPCPHTLYISRHIAKPTGIYPNAILPWALRGHCRNTFPSPTLFIWIQCSPENMFINTVKCTSVIFGNSFELFCIYLLETK